MKIIIDGIVLNGDFSVHDVEEFNYDGNFNIECINKIRETNTFKLSNETYIYLSVGSEATQPFYLPKNVLSINKAFITRDKKKYCIIPCNIVLIKNKQHLEYVEHSFPPTYTELTNQKIYDSCQSAYNALEKFLNIKDDIREKIIHLNECRDKIEKETIWRY